MVGIGDKQIKEVVRERYAEVARGASSCCGTGGCGQDDALGMAPLYASPEVEGLPSEATMASAGCGNPTAMASLMPGETVVDFGSGGGIDCFLAARAVGPEGRVIGVDMTPDMVELARSNARKLGLSNVEFHLTEMEHTPLPEDTADIIISNCVINLAPDKDAVFKEAFRLLRPGGRIFVSDMLLTAELPQEATSDVNNWVACLSGAEPVETYLGRMRGAGFTDVEISAETPLENSEGWKASVRSMNIKAVKPA